MPLSLMQKQLLDRLCSHYEDSFWNNEEAVDYFHNRGFSNSALKDFRIGFAPEAWNFPLTSVEDAKFLVDIHHIYLPHDTETDYEDFLSGRVVFPIRNPSGDVTGFTGRILTEEKSRAKYKNSAESAAFTKGEVLYGFYEAKESIYLKDKVILVEGNTDVMAFHQLGIKNTVAVMGSKLTDHNRALIGRYTKNVCMMFDNDKAGQASQSKIVKQLKEAGFIITKQSLPEGKDPADLIRPIESKP